MSFVSVDVSVVRQVYSGGKRILILLSVYSLSTLVFVGTRVCVCSGLPVAFETAELSSVLSLSQES